ncbi:TetR/AcrR family transcriptional regulator [Kitasatospora sp. NPDC018058]|uniref:TetR/AcrR family transcriptional regulator n=1 Tax=Kitasatospora sp. NPDC018058 TaxID=3364025 RepID=UPI0037BF9B4E
MNRSQRLPVGSGARQERAERILDITAELLEQHGYRRVTIDDVASRAGIGKGTVYLHWKTREALFWAVLQREALRLFDHLVDELGKEPTLALPHRLMRVIFLNGVRRPLVRALLLADAAVLGNLAQDESVRAAQQDLAENPDYLQMLADEGILRPELSGATAQHILANVARGFSNADELGEDDGLPLEARADLLAYVLRRSLENDTPPDSADLAKLNARVTEMFQAMADGHREQLQRAY